ncbi:hypothetical protein ABZ845_29385 [Streptomyces sp. NPDC047022]|uniref:hypothetical protein n=1 Tax=Streptomyces sp. NPDC047022 TaxID=3155737 RepID=UPI003408594B
MTLFLLLILVALILGIIGFATHGLFYLLIIGAALLLADLVYVAVRFHRGGSHHHRMAR